MYQLVVVIRKLSGRELGKNKHKDKQYLCLGES